jgi:serine/threonine protein kinase
LRVGKRTSDPSLPCSQTIAYGWEQRKLARTDEINWPHAADLALWCLQTEPERRPQSFEQILGHRFFDESGQLHLLDSDAAWHPPWHPPLLPTLKLAAARCTKEMHAAIRAGELEKLKAVFARGAVHVLAEMQNLSSIVLPFHHAAMRGNSEVMEFLMAEVPALHVDHESFGTNGDLLRFVKDVLDRQDQFGYTALHWCAAYNHADIARKLLKQGCDPSICNHSGKTAWDVAESANSTEVLALFDETSTITAEKEQSGPAPDQGVDESDKTVGCIEESLLRREWERRKRRPDVPPTSDDIELDHARLTYWNVEPYENWRQIGEGGNGRVFLVTEVAPTIQIVYNSKEVRQFHKAVVKFAKPDGVEMLKAEVESLSVLKHKNVVEILGMAEGGAPEMEGSRWMMLLEFCESDLNRLLHVNDDPKNYSWKLMGRLCREIVDGMAYLHGKEHEATKQTYMHLDLKPDNILLANEGTKEQPVWTAKIADFGWDPQLKQDEWTGTALYMAPEFAIRILELDKLYRGVALPTDSKGNDIDVGPAADVFSFGVLLWEMFARKTPFDALAALKGGTPPPCSCASPLQSGTACLRKMSKWMVGEDQLRPVIPVNFPAALRLLVEACWAEEPVSRPNFADIQQALQSMHVDWFAPTATPAPPAPPQTVQEWLDKLGLGSKLELLESYLQGTPKTIEDNAFREFVEDEDLDDYVDEMVGEGDDELNADELNVDEAAKLKAALHDLIGEDGADPEAGQESQDWDALVKSFGRPGTQTMLERNDNELKRLREEVVQLRAEVRRGAQGTSGTMVSEQTFRELLEPEPEPESEPDEI